MRPLRMPQMADTTRIPSRVVGQEPQTYVATKDFYIGGIKSKIQNGDELQILGNIVILDGERFRIPHIQAAVKNKFLVPRDQVAKIAAEQTTGPANRVEVRQYNPKRKVVETGVYEIEHDSGGIMPVNFNEIPSPGAEDVAPKKEPHFDYERWQALHWRQKLNLLTELGDLDILKTIQKIESSSGVKKHIASRIKQVESSN